MILCSFICSNQACCSSYSGNVPFLASSEIPSNPNNSCLSLSLSPYLWLFVFTWFLDKTRTSSLYLHFQGIGRESENTHFIQDLFFWLSFWIFLAYLFGKNEFFGVVVRCSWAPDKNKESHSIFGFSFRGFCEWFLKKISPLVYVNFVFCWISIWRMRSLNWFWWSFGWFFRLPTWIILMEYFYRGVQNQEGRVRALTQDQEWTLFHQARPRAISKQSPPWVERQLLIIIIIIRRLSITPSCPTSNKHHWEW